MIHDLFRSLDLGDTNSGACHSSWIDPPGGGELASIDPSTGQPLARVRMASADDYERIVTSAQEAFASWRNVPAPKRGEVVRQIGLALRERKRELGLLVTLETG